MAKKKTTDIIIDILCILIVVLVLAGICRGCSSCAGGLSDNMAKATGRFQSNMEQAKKEADQERK